MLSLSANVTVHDWIVETQLGSGGQGVVWRVKYAKERHSPRRALKLCQSDDNKAQARFAREVELLRDQKHPGIVGLIAHGEHQGYPYYVMELATTTLQKVVAGDTAGTRLVRESGVVLLGLLRQACAALAHLHEQGVVHRDLKPSNVLLMLEPPDPLRAVLSDLGTAAHESQQGSLTATHEVIGTPGFLAPESMNGVHTSASDVYAFGKVVEFVLARGLSSGIGPGRCSRSPLFSTDLWDALDGLLRGACAFDPSQRFQTAAELLASFPDVVVARAGEPPVSAMHAEVTLSVPEILTLASVLAACSTTGEWAAVSAVRGNAGIVAHQFSLSMRSLSALGFIEHETSQQWGEEDCVVCQPTKAGVQWALCHRALVDTVVREESSSTQVSSNEEDIPF